MFYKRVLTESGRLSRFLGGSKTVQIRVVDESRRSVEMEMLYVCVWVCVCVCVCVALMREMQILTASRSIQTLAYTQATRGDLKETLHFARPLETLKLNADTH